MAKQRSIPHVKLTQHLIAETDKSICFLTSWSRKLWISKDKLRSFKIKETQFERTVTMWIPEESARSMGLL